MYNAYGKVTVLNGESGYDGDGVVTEWTVDTGGSDWANAYLYCGYRYDHESRLYHVRYRSYHPTLGRWLQRDPIGYADGMSLYEYVACRPTCSVDPHGRRRIEHATNVDETKTLRDKIVARDGLPPNSDPELPSYVSGMEVGLGVGAGLNKVTCCTEDGTYRTMKFYKVCHGGMVSAGAYGGTVEGMDGESCKPETYAGWFWEWGFSVGPVSGFYDVGLKGDDWNPLSVEPVGPLGFGWPKDPWSGVSEWGLGISKSFARWKRFSVKIAVLCKYTHLPPSDDMAPGASDNPCPCPESSGGTNAAEP